MKMNNFTKVIIMIFFVFVVNNLFAEYKCTNEGTTKSQDSEQIQNNLRTSIYLHPVTLLLFLETNFSFPLIYVTIEKPLDLSKSLIIKPSFWGFDITGLNPQGGNTDRYRLGSDFGLRYYPNKKVEGFYLQGQTGLFYMYNYDRYMDIDNRNDIWVDVMGYLGWTVKTKKISAFFDVGIGFGYSSFGSNSFEIYNWYNDKCLLLVDINLGFGISL